ncbi:hypothetical protein Baya_12703 [Bagarius yarrelli]|uniref:Uncharacterized protein n=1 Tax=Bagarius yarrelli TaxID=175774 RepID=A0A556V3R5_BAGYA|nr:hypothetical protein Baya_12703 [Bagarius yarrelli]
MTIEMAEWKAKHVLCGRRHREQELLTSYSGRRSVLWPCCPSSAGGHGAISVYGSAGSKLECLIEMLGFGLVKACSEPEKLKKTHSAIVH